MASFDDNYHKYRFPSNVQMVADVLRMTALNTHVPLNCHPVIESTWGTGGGPMKHFSPDTVHPVQFTQLLNKALRSIRSRPTQRHSFYLATFNNGASPIISYQRINAHEIPVEFAPENILYNPITGAVRFISRGLTDGEKRSMAQIKRARLEGEGMVPDRAYYQRMMDSGICNVDASGSRLSSVIECSGAGEVPNYYQTHPLFRNVPDKYSLPTRGRSVGVNDFETCSRVKPAAGVVIGLDSSLSSLNILNRQVNSGNTVTRYVSNGVYTRSCNAGSTHPGCQSQPPTVAGIPPQVSDAVTAIVQACIRQSERVGGGGADTATALGVGSGETETAIHNIIRTSSTPSSLIGHTMQYLRSMPDNPVNVRAAKYFMAILVNMGYLDPNDTAVRRILARDVDVTVAPPSKRRIIAGGW